MAIPMCEGQRHIFIVGRELCRCGQERSLVLDPRETHISVLVVKQTWKTVEVVFCSRPNGDGIEAQGYCGRCQSHSFPLWRSQQRHGSGWPRRAASRGRCNRSSQPTSRGQRTRVRADAASRPCGISRVRSGCCHEGSGQHTGCVSEDIAAPQMAVPRRGLQPTAPADGRLIARTSGRKSGPRSPSRIVRRKNEAHAPPSPHPGARTSSSGRSTTPPR